MKEVQYSKNFGWGGESIILGKQKIKTADRKIDSAGSFFFVLVA